jgi:hypothetical protein
VFYWGAYSSSYIRIHPVSLHTTEMKHRNTVLGLLVAAATMVPAFRVPEGLPTGVYAVSFDPLTGEALGEFESLHPSLADRSMRIRPLGPRQDRKNPPPLEKPRTICAATDLDRADFDAAKARLVSRCDEAKIYSAHTAVVAATDNGTTIAYMCNFDNENRCWREEYDEASGILDRDCGRRRIGMVYVDRWKKSYGRDLRGADICLNAP